MSQLPRRRGRQEEEEEEEEEEAATTEGSGVGAKADKILKITL